MDGRIDEAIREAVSEAGQSEALAKKLIAWMDSVISGNENLADKQATELRLEVVYQATEVEED